MSSAVDVWFSVLLVALFGALLLLRVHFPKASRRSETAVLVSTALLFFIICDRLFVPHKTAARMVPAVHAAVLTSNE